MPAPRPRRPAIPSRAWLAGPTLALAVAAALPPGPAVATAAGAPPDSAAPALEPPPDDWDWVQIKSQEWLKGELRAMQDKSLEFYSDKFKRLDLDWYDVRYLRSPKPFTVLRGKQLLNGSLRTERGQLVVVGSPDARMPFLEVESITSGLPREIDKWRFKVTAGGTTRSGNSESVDFSSHLLLTRRTPTTRASADYSGNVGSTGGEQTTNNHRTFVGADFMLGPRWFARVPQVEFYRDPFQNIRHRLTMGAGAGYRLYDRKELDWWVAAGPAYQQVRFVTVGEGDEDLEATPSFFLQTRLDRDLVSHLDLTLLYAGLLTSPEAGRMIHHTVATLDFGIGWRWDIDLSLTWDRTEEPQPAADGTTPRKDDFRTAISLGIDL
jgi:hypothetical protein